MLSYPFDAPSKHFTFENYVTREKTFVEVSDEVRGGLLPGQERASASLLCIYEATTAECMRIAV